jgi:hypothetical protein
MGKRRPKIDEEKAVAAVLQAGLAKNPEQAAAGMRAFEKYTECYEKNGVYERPSQPVYRQKPPQDWDKLSAAMLLGWETRQAEIRAHLMLGGSVSLSKVGWYLERVRETLPKSAGDWLSLVYPDASGTGPGGVVWFRRGYYADEHNHRHGIVVTDSRDALQADMLESHDRGNDHPLALLHLMVEDMVCLFGCEPWEAVGYLLCDRVFDMPLLKVEYVTGQWSRLVITAAPSHVAMREVGRAFMEAKVDAGYSTRPSDPSSQRLVQFIKARRPGKTWPDIHGEWLRQEGAKQYHTWQSMKRVYEVADRELPWQAAARERAAQAEADAEAKRDETAARRSRMTMGVGDDGDTQ